MREMISCSFTRYWYWEVCRGYDWWRSKPQWGKRFTLHTGLGALL